MNVCLVLCSFLLSCLSLSFSLSLSFIFALSAVLPWFKKSSHLQCFAHHQDLQTRVVDFGHEPHASQQTLQCFPPRCCTVQHYSLSISHTLGRLSMGIVAHVLLVFSFCIRKIPTTQSDETRKTTRWNHGKSPHQSQTLPGTFVRRTHAIDWRELRHPCSNMLQGRGGDTKRNTHS